MSAEQDRARLAPDAAPGWLSGLVDNLAGVPTAQSRYIPPDVQAAFAAASATAMAEAADPEATARALRTALEVPVGG